MTALDDEEQRLRIDQMTIDIEKLRADMRWETRKFVVSFILAIAASLAAGVALANYVNSRQPFPPQYPAQFPPGTVITIPPAPAPAR